MTYAENRYRVVYECDPFSTEATVQTFPTLEEAREFTRGSATRYEIQRAIEAEDGSIFEWERTHLSESSRNVHATVAKAKAGK